MESVLERVEAPTRVEPPSLKHRVCPCQIDVEPSFTRCGIRCRGKGGGRPISSTPPQDLCVVCQDLALSGVPCRYCGKPAL